MNWPKLFKRNSKPGRRNTIRATNTFMKMRGKKMDPVVFGAIVGAASAGLAVPAAILATIQIKERFAKKQSFEQLTEKGKEWKKTKQVTTIRFRIGPVEMEIEKASFAEISDLSK